MEIQLSELQQYNPSNDLYVTVRRNSIYVGRSLGVYLKFKFCHVFYHPSGIVVEFTNTETLSTIRIIHDRDQKRIKLSNFCMIFNVDLKENKYQFEQIHIDGLSNTWLVNLQSNSLPNSTRIKTTTIPKRSVKDFDIQDYQIKFCDRLLKTYKFIILVKNFEFKNFKLIFTNDETSLVIPIINGNIYHHLPPVLDFTYTVSKEGSDLVYDIQYESTVAGFTIVPISDALFSNNDFENESVLAKRELYIASRNRTLKHPTTLINLEEYAKIGVVPLHPFIAFKNL